MIARRLLDDCLMTVSLLPDDLLETLEILVIVNGEWLRDIIQNNSEPYIKTMHVQLAFRGLSTNNNFISTFQ